MPDIIPILAGIIGGGLGKAAIDWMRGKKSDTATVHKTESDALLISTQMVKTWLHDAGEAQVTIHQLRIDGTQKDITIIGQNAKLIEADEKITALKESLKQCHDSLAACKESR